MIQITAVVLQMHSVPVKLLKIAASLVLMLMHV
jgi:hypothetical protein